MQRSFISRITGLRHNIELHFNLITICASILLVTALTFFAYNVVNDLTHDIAQDYAELYSFKTTAVLNSQLNKDIGILTSAAHSLPIVDWFADEYDSVKKETAFLTMKNFINMLNNGILYFGIESSGREFNFDRTTSSETFQSTTFVSPDNPDDSWYFDTLVANQPYMLNVDTDKILRRTLVWINHKVLSPTGEALGVLCTGVPFDQILESAFDQYDVEDIRGVVVDRHSLVQMDSAAQNQKFIDNSTLKFEDIFSYPILTDAIKQQQASMESYFTAEHKPQVVTLPEDSTYTYAAVSPIEGTDWIVVTFFRTASLFSLSNFMPILWIAVALFLVFTIIVTVTSRALLFVPLSHMVRSLRLHTNEHDNAKLHIHTTQIKKPHAIYGCDRHDELGVLAITIQRLRRKLHRNNIRLAHAADEAKNASQAKTHFLAHMSHEMRTPMNAIIGMAKIAKESNEPEKTLACIAKIETASSHLLAIINDVLDMSKIEANKIDINLGVFDFAQTIRRIVNVIGFRMADKGQFFTTEVDPRIPARLVSDEQRVAQVITNFLSNAEKFTPEGGNIALKANLMASDDKQCHIHLSVTDSGMGVSAEQQKLLFQPFQQANSSISHKFGGTGLGLAICKQIIELMGGVITFHSEEGKGTCIAFVLPCNRPDDKGVALYEETLEAEQIETLDLHDKTILIVEDIEINQEIVMALLEDTGATIDVAVNGLRGLEKFSANPERYALILMDIRMPEMDGYEATRRIRALDNEHARTVPIIAMTANAFREDVEACLQAGMNAHVGKPIDFNELFLQLKRAVLQKR